MNSQTNYEEYKQLLTSALEKQSEEIVFRKQLKNNNVSLDAVCLKNKSVSPVVYLESYFESFKSGTSIEEIANQILDVLHSSPTDIVENETRHLFDYEENKDRIFPAVINYSQNEDYIFIVAWGNSMTKNKAATFRIEAPYNPDADAPTYDRFLKDISCNDIALVDTFNELLGYVLSIYTKCEKFITISGYGANGKSTYLSLLSSFVGLHNISNISVNEINSKAFSRHFIADKRLNIIYEGESDMVMSELMRGAVKQIVTGDPTSAEIKGGRNYSFIPKLKLIMATNTFPRIDKIPDHATVRRLLILPFNNHFSADKADKDMLNKLLAEQSGIP